MFVCMMPFADGKNLIQYKSVKPSVSIFDENINMCRFSESINRVWTVQTGLCLYILEFGVWLYKV